MITSGSERRIERRRGSEAHVGLGIDLNLVDPGEPVLDRILDRDDVDLRIRDLGEGRVERRRLTRAGRPGHEQRARRLADDRRDRVAHRLGETERLERRGLARLVDQPHHDLLALDRRQHRDTDVEEPADRAGVQRHATVLRPPALGDVELGENLEARGDTRGHALRDALRLGEHAVDARPDDERILLRLEVDVAGPVARRLHDDRVDEPNERCVRDAVVGLELALGVFVDDLEIAHRRLRLEHLALPREPLELGQDLFLTGDCEIDGMTGGDPELIDPEDVRGIGDRDEQPIVDELDRHGDDTLERAERDELHRARRRSLLVEVEVREPMPTGGGTSNALGAGKPFIAKRLCERAGARSAPSRGETVARDDVGGGDQLRDKVCDRLETTLRGRSRSRLGVFRRGRPQLVSWLRTQDGVTR